MILWVAKAVLLWKVNCGTEGKTDEYALNQTQSAKILRQCCLIYSGHFFKIECW